MFNNIINILRSKENNETMHPFNKGVIEVACIFIRVGKLDNHMAPIEMEKIKSLLLKRFDLEKAQLNSIISKAEELELGSKNTRSTNG